MCFLTSKGCQPNIKTLWHSCLRTFVPADPSIWNMCPLDTLWPTFSSPLGLYLNAKISGKFSFTTLFDAEHHPLFLLLFIFISHLIFHLFFLMTYHLFYLFILLSIFPNWIPERWGFGLVGRWSVISDGNHVCPILKCSISVCWKNESRTSHGNLVEGMLNSACVYQGEASQRDDALLSLRLTILDLFSANTVKDFGGREVP